MGGWGIVAAYLGGWLALLAARFARRRKLVLPLGGAYPAHLLLASAVLADAAVLGSRRIAGPLGVALLLALLSGALRGLWLLVGESPEGALERLELLCGRRGVDASRDGGALVLKRLGAAVRKTWSGPGLGLLRLDRRRREAMLDRLLREWARTPSGSRGRP